MPDNIGVQPTGTDLFDPKRILPKRLGTFSLHGRIGVRGSNAVVLDASTENGERVALKLIRPSGDSDRQKAMLARFHNSTRFLRLLDHPGVVKLVDAGEHQGVMYIAVQRIQGVRLTSILEIGPLDVPAIVALGVHMADTVAHLHEIEVVSVTIAPDFVVVESSGKPIFTDVGLSWLRPSGARGGSLPRSAQTPYVAPEVRHGGPLSPRADQYSLGRILFDACMIGERKGLASRPGATAEIDWSGFPAVGGYRLLREIVERMVATDPENRYRDMYECIADLAQVASLQAAAPAPSHSTPDQSVERQDSAPEYWDDASKVFRPAEALEVLAASRAKAREVADWANAHDSGSAAALGPIIHRLRTDFIATRGPEPEGAGTESFLDDTQPGEGDVFSLVEPIELLLLEDEPPPGADELGHADPWSSSHRRSDLMKRMGASAFEYVAKNAPGWDDTTTRGASLHREGARALLDRKADLRAHLKQNAQAFWTARLAPMSAATTDKESEIDRIPTIKDRAPSTRPASAPKSRPSEPAPLLAASEASEAPPQAGEGGRWDDLTQRGTTPPSQILPAELLYTGFDEIKTAPESTRIPALDSPGAGPAVEVIEVAREVSLVTRRDASLAARTAPGDPHSAATRPGPPPPPPPSYPGIEAPAPIPPIAQPAPKPERPQSQDPPSPPRSTSSDPRPISAAPPRSTSNAAPPRSSPPEVAISRSPSSRVSSRPRTDERLDPVRITVGKETTPDHPAIKSVPRSQSSPARPEPRPPSPSRLSAAGVGSSSVDSTSSAPSSLSRMFVTAILACAIGFVATAALERNKTRGQTPEVEMIRVVDVKGPPTGSETPSLLFKRSMDHHPNTDERNIAERLLQASRQALAERRIQTAERNLGMCIELADLPDCHKILGLILTVTEHPSARAHLERYVELAPNDREAGLVRAGLRTR